MTRQALHPTRAFRGPSDTRTMPGLDAHTAHRGVTQEIWCFRAPGVTSRLVCFPVPQCSRLAALATGSGPAMTKPGHDEAVKVSDGDG
jgi:hypothetical protein